MTKTKEMLEIGLKTINSHSRNRYGFHIAYGKYSLVKEEDHGGISLVSGFTTKSEMYDIVSAIANYLEREDATRKKEEM